MPSEIPLPSPDALSPSGLKSNSQFYSSFEGSNPRRRPSQDPIGKSEEKSSVTDYISESFLCSVFKFVCTIISPAEVFKST